MDALELFERDAAHEFAVEVERVQRQLESAQQLFGVEGQRVVAQPQRPHQVELVEHAFRQRLQVVELQVQRLQRTYSSHPPQ